MRSVRGCVPLAAIAVPVRLGRSRWRRLNHRVIISIASLTALFASALVFSTAPALAYTPRTYESQLSSGLFAPENIAIDLADRVWVTDNSSGLISEFNPEGEKLPPQIHQVSPRVYSAADDHSNNDLYEANNFENSIEVYGPTGELLKSFAPESGHLTIAADNSPVRPRGGYISPTASNSAKAQR